MRKLLVLLPCTNKKPYTEAPTWKFVLKHLSPYLEHVDIAAVDCITNPRTGLPFGIVSRRSQRLTVGKDERPDPKKLESLVKEIRRQLRRRSYRYDRIVSYLNVKSYWKALDEVRDEFEIKMLPKIYAKNDVWNSKKLHMGPIGMFRTEIGDLVTEVKRHVNGTAL
jgi:predicted RNA-binding protein